MNRTIRLGIFTAVGLFAIVGFSVYVNDRPYWYRPCNRVGIAVDDATGLRRKSPVKTLGLEIGFIESIGLSGDKVRINVCITGPVKLTPETKAFVRSAGFLGDKFLELKPVDLEGNGQSTKAAATNKADPAPKAIEEKNDSSATDKNQINDKVESRANAPDREPMIPVEKIESEPDYSKILSKVMNFIWPSAHAADGEVDGQNPDGTLTASREAEIADTMKKVGKLVDQLTLMVEDVRDITSQRDFKDMAKSLSAAMKNLETALRPNGKLLSSTTDALDAMKRSMQKLENIMRKVDEGEGTIGKFVNDPSIFDELKGAIKSVNLLLGKAGSLKTYVDLSTWKIKAYDGYKSKFSVMIAPEPGRYYLLGITYDPRGKDTRTTTTTIVNNGVPTIEEKNVNQEAGLRVTAMLGKYFGPVDLRVGFLEDGGAAGMGFSFDSERRYQIQMEVFKASKREAIAVRAYAKAHIYSGLYLTGGIDNNRKFNNQFTYFAGAGLFFNDEDLKYLLAFR